MTLNHQLTRWVRKEKDIQFAVDQLKKHGGKPFELRAGKDGYAIFVEETGKLPNETAINPILSDSP